VLVRGRSGREDQKFFELCDNKMRVKVGQTEVFTAVQSAHTLQPGKENAQKFQKLESRDFKDDETKSLGP
jgi:hypothetical protein